MKRKFRIIVGMLLLAIPLCVNAQVKPTKPERPKPKTEKSEKHDEGEKPDPFRTQSIPIIGGDSKYSKTVVCPDGCVMFKLTAKPLGNENFFKGHFWSYPDQTV